MLHLTSPQSLLDAIHRANIPGLYDPHLQPRAQRQALDDAEAQLAEVRADLEKLIDGIEKKKRKQPDEARRLRAPYDLLLNLVTECEGLVSDLREIVAKGQILPDAVTFGTVIFGSQETGEWFLGDPAALQRWEEAEALKRRLETFEEERRPLSEELKSTKADMESLQNELRQAIARYKARQPRRYILQRLLVLFVLGALLAAGGGLLVVSGVLVGAAGVALGALLWLLMPVLYQRWRRGLAQLQERIQNWKAELASIKQRGQKIQIEYMNIMSSLKAVQQEYRELRATLG